MKKLKNIKEWLEDKDKQFIVKSRYQSGNIQTVQRIKDDAIFHVGRQNTFAYLKIIEFYEDCIYVQIKFNLNETTVKTMSCRINDIQLSDDGSKIVGWQGIKE